MMSETQNEVDTYIAESDEKARPHLKEVRKIIKSTFPDVEEGIKWGVPWYEYHGMLSGYTAYKNHITIEIWADELSDQDREMLEEKGYRTGKRTFMIEYDQEVPTTAVQQVLKRQAKKNKASKDS